MTCGSGFVAEDIDGFSLNADKVMCFQIQIVWPLQAHRYSSLLKF